MLSYHHCMWHLLQNILMFANLFPVLRKLFLFSSKVISNNILNLFPEKENASFLSRNEFSIHTCPPELKFWHMFLLMIFTSFFFLTYFVHLVINSNLNSCISLSKLAKQQDQERFAVQTGETAWSGTFHRPNWRNRVQHRGRLQA